jgi:hypothetical protein
MLAYLVRRLLYAMPILIGVNLITFALFFVVNTPDDMARMQLGVKRVTPEAIERWKAERGYDKPLFINAAASGSARVHRHHFLQQVGAHVCRRFRARRGRPRHRPRNQHAHGAVAGHRAADLHPRPAGDGLLCPAADLLPRQLSRFLGRRAVRGDDVDLRPVLHHRRPVPGQQAVEAGADLGLRRRARRLEVPHPAGADRRRLRHRFVDALVSHDLPRGNRQGLRAHGARQGACPNSPCFSATSCATR